MNDLGRLGGIKGWRKVPLPCQIRVLLSGQIHLNELIVRNTLATALFDHILQEWIFISLSCLKINRTKSQNFISQKSQTSKNLCKKVILSLNFIKDFGRSSENCKDNKLLYVMNCFKFRLGTFVLINQIGFSDFQLERIICREFNFKKVCRL